jgi:hypothetical protein
MSKAVELTSKADEFRQQTKEFWSKMDQIGKVGATDHKVTPKKLSVERADPKQKKKKNGARARDRRIER